MITFIYGGYGSGKTTALMEALAKDANAGKHTFLIVPEQESVQSELATLNILPPTAQLDLEVLSFSRLYNRVCREYGGLSYRYITKPIKHLLMWQNMRELAPLLEEYGSVCSKDTSLSEIMLSAIGECKACAISPDQLEKTANALDPSDPLKKRLRDLALIYASYDRLVSENYSDSADDLARLYEILKKERFFAGCNVYIDSFSSFTAIEHRIIERIFAQADNVTVTVPLPSPDYNDISVASIRASMQKLIASAAVHGTYDQIILTDNKRATSPALAYLSENIWKMDMSTDTPAVPIDDSICLESCDTPYAEAEAAAAHILELLRSGERCKDITVLMRDPEKYRGIIEPAFDRCGIPYFFSQKTDLCTLPPVKLILSALRIKQYNWQKDDIVSHVKTGMYDFPSRSIDLFEEYMSTWNIHGARFTGGEWTMNPDGFAEKLSERGREILNAANEIRTSLSTVLEKFFILLDAAENVPDMCRAVYTYLTDIDLEKRLSEIARLELKKGDRKSAKETLSLWGIILNTLADIAAAMPDQSADTEEFFMILKTVFRQTDIGTIPTSVDEVTVGSAAMLRSSNEKFVFVLGLCDGEFPAAINDKGIFSFGERQQLSDLGIELSSNADTRSSDELMYAARAFASPSHRLYLFTSVAELGGKARSASLPFTRVCKLFGIKEPHRYSGNDLRYLSGSAKSAASHIRTLSGTSEGESLMLALCDHIPNISELSSAPISDIACTIPTDTVDKVVGKELDFSASRFESYINCPFNYYCTYVLGLREKKKSNFRVADIGTFIHHVLEHLLKFATEEDENGNPPDDATLIAKTEEVVTSYINLICPDELKSSKRLRHLYTRLKRLSLLMVRNIVEEFSQSEFRPAFFELNTNGNGNNPAPMEFALDDGTHVSLHGIIDRVDLLKKDGELYVRIVDYKTGSKTFSLDDVMHGINIQMLLYLFTLCRQSDTPFCRSLGLADSQKLTPAGVIYLSANIPVIKAEEYMNEEDTLKKAADSLKRSGVLLSDENILLAMNSELSPKFLAGVRRLKDGRISGGALTSSEGFDKLYKNIETTVKKIACELRGGVANAEPLNYKSNDPCAYCKMKPICRRSDK